MSPWLKWTIVLSFDLCFAAWFVWRLWKWAKPPALPAKNPPCVRCSMRGLDREAGFVVGNEWICAEHMDEQLRDEQRMRDEAKQQRRDAMLDGARWTQRLIKRQQDLANHRR